MTSANFDFGANFELGDTSKTEKNTPLKVYPSYAEVAVAVPLRSVFTYGVPAELAQDIAPGAQVRIRFGARATTGFVVRVVRDLAETKSPQINRVAPILGLAEGLALSADQTAFLKAAAEYYLHPIGEVFEHAAGVTAASRQKKSKGIADPLKVGLSEVLVLWVRRAKPLAENQRLGKRQSALYDATPIDGEVRWSDLSQKTDFSKATLRRLESLGLLALRELAADPRFATTVVKDAPKALTLEQTNALKILRSEAAASKPVLLFGVTGSGKTEVYLRRIGDMLEQGRGSLVLVPEIALTPQLVERFRARFGDALSVLHSGLTERERLIAWRSLDAGRTKVAIGARSAVFAPAPNLGLLIVDEEHDPSYKQEEGFRYNGRDLAVLRAHLLKAQVILGSATPSLESYAAAIDARYVMVRMNERPSGLPMPKVELLDLRKVQSGVAGEPNLTMPFVKAVERTLARGEQCIVFLNRRGFAPIQRCSTCGAAEECPLCSVSLTVHRGRKRLHCHYCDFSRPTEKPCSSCGGPSTEYWGSGTERVVAALESLFPNARVGRLDRDVSSSGQAEVMTALRNQTLDIVVGTQMVTKGHDIPTVTLVGVLSADQSLQFPDFRAAERTFQLLTQVAGRAGRSDRMGEVIIQSYQPGHPSIMAAAKHDYLAFAKEELAIRKDLTYPPYGRMIMIRLDSADEKQLRAFSISLADQLARLEQVQHEKVFVKGPAEAPVYRVRNRFRMRILLLGADRPQVRAVANQALVLASGAPKSIRFSLDVDPVNML